jgi:hypothetical protein
MVPRHDFNEMKANSGNRAAEPGRLAGDGSDGLENSFS